METKLKNNLAHLRIAISRTNTIIAANNEDAIERHLSGLKELIAETDRAKRECEAVKVAAEEDIEADQPVEFRNRIENN